MPSLARFLVVLAAAIAAAGSIGKLVPHIGQLVAGLGISLGAAGFLVSAVMLPGALAGPLFGALVDRLPPRRVALGGLTLQGLASFGLVFASDFYAIALLRLAEG